MILAEIEITAANGFMAAGFYHRIRYDNVAAAEKAFHEVVDLLRRRGDKANDLPRLIELEGVNRLSLPLDAIQSVALIDYEKQNAEERGMHDAFPHLKFS